MIWLARYLMTEKKVNIVEDVTFGSSNKVFSAVLTQSTLHAICLRGVTRVHAKQLFGQTNQQSRTFNRFCIVCMRLYNGQTVFLGHL